MSLVFNFIGGDGEPVPLASEAAATTTTTKAVVDQTTKADNTAPLMTDPPSTTQPLSTHTGAVVGIKVDNAVGARPQVGIGEAPLLVEYPVEGGITRFIAVYPRESSGIAGPIRSLRPVDAELLPAIAPIVVSTGGRPFVLRDVEAAGVRSITASASSMFVSLGRPDPHDTFVDLELLGSILDDTLLSAGGGLPDGGALPLMRSVALMVESPLGPSTFVFEQGRGYTRMESGESFEVLGLDGETVMSLTHDTLVFVFAAERSAGYTDSNDVAVSTFDVIGSGDLLVFHGGEVLTGTWSRSAMEDPFVFQDDIGEPFGLSEGRTYLAIVPRDGEVAYR